MFFRDKNKSLIPRNCFISSIRVPPIFQIESSYLNSGSIPFPLLRKLLSISSLSIKSSKQQPLLFLNYKSAQARPYWKAFNAFSLLKECALTLCNQGLSWIFPANLIKHIYYHLHPITYTLSRFSWSLRSRNTGPYVVSKTWKTLSGLHAFHVLFFLLLSAMLRKGATHPSKNGYLKDDLFTYNFPCYHHTLHMTPL